MKLTCLSGCHLMTYCALGFLSKKLKYGLTNLMPLFFDKNPRAQYRLKIQETV